MAYTHRAISISNRASDQTQAVMPSVTTSPSPRLKYRVMVNKRSRRGSLVDRGANGGILGNDAKVILQHHRSVDVTGIDNHELNALKIVDASARVMTQRGPVILVMRQYAYHGRDRTIHSAPQIEFYKNRVDDRSMKAGGLQCIKTVEGYYLPLDIVCGLPYLRMEPNTDDEWKSLPHVILTSGDPWDPRALDNNLTDHEDWFSKVKA